MIIGRKKVAKTDLHSHHESLPATAETFKYVLDQKTPGIKYFPIRPSHRVNTNKIHEFLTPNNSHPSQLNNLPINLSSKCGVRMARETEIYSWISTQNF